MESVVLEVYLDHRSSVEEEGKTPVFSAEDIGSFDTGKLEEGGTIPRTQQSQVSARKYEIGKVEA